jgi:hypothetical protein
MFSGKEFGPLGFSRREEYIGGRAMSGGGPRAHTTWWRSQGWPVPPYGMAAPLRLVSGKIGTSAFVLSNSENISCVTFLKHKNSRKQGNGTVASR